MTNGWNLVIVGTGKILKRFFFLIMAGLLCLCFIFSTSRNDFIVRIFAFQKLKTLIDGATDGIIYFSFGSNLKMSDLPERHVRMFVESFRKIPQKVLWKWENGTIDNAPDNVYLSSWFPQQYILSMNYEKPKFDYMLIL